jgi:hypothetical protein
VSKVVSIPVRKEEEDLEAVWNALNANAAEEANASTKDKPTEDTVKIEHMYEFAGETIR